jgi:hypothetical protein
MPVIGSRLITILPSSINYGCLKLIVQVFIDMKQIRKRYFGHTDLGQFNGALE